MGCEVREHFWLLTKITLVIARRALTQGKLGVFFLPLVSENDSQACGELALQANLVKGSSLPL